MLKAARPRTSGSPHSGSEPLGRTPHVGPRSAPFRTLLVPSHRLSSRYSGITPRPVPPPPAVWVPPDPARAAPRRPPRGRRTYQKPLGSRNAAGRPHSPRPRSPLPRRVQDRPAARRARARGPAARHPAAARPAEPRAAPKPDGPAPLGAVYGQEGALTTSPGSTAAPTRRPRPSPPSRVQSPSTAAARLSTARQPRPPAHLSYDLPLANGAPARSLLCLYGVPIG